MAFKPVKHSKEAKKLFKDREKEVKKTAKDEEKRRKKLNKSLFSVQGDEGDY